MKKSASMVMPRTVALRPRKSLGQNFLRDENIARKIVASIRPLSGDVMLEIGPGEGVLTKYLAPRVRKLIIVDIDERVIRRMREQYAGARVEILHQDFLTTDITGLAEEHGDSRQSRAERRLRVVGNIPYNITSPILFHTLEHRRWVSDLTIMIQREVARRLVAVPGTKDYGILSVFCQLMADVAILFDVSGNAFYPKPKVTSSVVHLSILESPRVAIVDEQLFRGMVRSLFGKRRKTLRNSLRYFLQESGTPLPEEFDLQRRPEDLSIEELADLSNTLSKSIPGE